MKLLSEHQSQILESLKKKSVLSVDSLTTELGLAKTAVRRNLLSMEKRNLIERVLQPAGRGRPSLAFRLTPSAHKLFPSKEAELLSSLLNFLISSGHEPLVDRFFENYWQERFEKIQMRLQKKGKNDLQTRLEVLKEELEKEGFMPRSSFSKKGTQLSLKECHCPIEAASRITQLPCQLEKRLIARVLNSSEVEASIRTDEQNHCEFQLPISKLTRKTKA